MESIQDYELKVFITHHVSDVDDWIKRCIDFVAVRFRPGYLRSWARLFKHGTRGHKFWRKDIMTDARRAANVFRDAYLAQVIRQIELIPARGITFYIYSNMDIAAPIVSPSSQVILRVVPDLKRPNSRNNSPWEEKDARSPWRLLWQHKADLIELSHDPKHRNNLFVVIENDTLISEGNLVDWLRNRKLLKKYNLLPSFLRIEFKKATSEWKCIDIHNKEGLNNIKVLEAEGTDSKFVQIPSLYSGTIILDWELLKEYVASDAISIEKSKRLIWWDLGARSSAGLQFWRIPEGFHDRYVIEICPKTNSVRTSSTIHHLPNLYVSVPKVQIGMPNLSELREMIIDNEKHRVR